jgi:hypothetical protein
LSNQWTFLNETRGNAVAAHTAEDRFATHRRTAESLVQGTILPALETVRDELHRPEQQQHVTITPLSPTSAELTIAPTPPDAGDRSGAAVSLRYVLTVAFDARAIVVKRIVNGTKGSFLGQHHVSSLRQRAIVDDVRRVWRRAAHKQQAGR